MALWQILLLHLTLETVSSQKCVWDGALIDFIYLKRTFCVSLTNLDLPLEVQNSPDVLEIENSTLPFLDKTVFSESIRENIKYLSVKNCQVKNVSADAFEDFVQLSHLDLTQNKLTQIEFVGRNLSKLEVLHLTGNQLSQVGKQSFPKNLTQLYLNNNGLTSQIVAGTMPNLDLLDLSSNHLRVTNGAFSGFAQVTTLDLSHNDIEKLLEESFAGLANVQTLNLSNCRINEVDPKALAPLSQLRYLDLSYNPLGVLKKNVLAKAQKLRFLDLSFSELKDLELSPFSAATDLEMLNLRNNKLSQLQKGTFQKLPKLKQLFLQDNNLWLLDLEVFDGLNHLTELDLSGNKLSELDKIFPAHNSLRKLSLGKNALTNLNPTVFNLLPQLTHLDLRNNKLQLVRTGTFSGLRNLKLLDLSNNNLIGVEPKAFQGLNNLVTLILAQNQMDHLETGTFSDLHSLRMLNMSKTGLRILEPDAFGTIAQLDLSQNHLKVLKKGVFTNRGTLKIDFSGNEISLIEPGAFGPEIFDGFASNHLRLDHNSLTVLQQGVFAGMENVSVLSLENNVITGIEPGAFARFFMHPFKENKIILSANRIGSIRSGTFYGIENLMTLEICHNEIQNIEARAFYGLNSLTTLNLQGNKIQTLIPDAFNGLASLTTLILSRNQIVSIYTGAFKYFPRLASLQLDQNSLEKLNNSLFSNLANLLALNVSFNQFSEINELSLFPLENLEVLDLEGNCLQYLNYKLLLEHNLKLRLVNLQGNRWRCMFLLEVLQIFKSKEIDYRFDTAGRYDDENIEGVYCVDGDSVTDRQENNPSNAVYNLSATIRESVKILLTNFSRLSELKLENGVQASAKSTSAFTQFLVIISSLLSCICLIVLTYIRCKTSRRIQRASSEMQLLSYT